MPFIGQLLGKNRTSTSRAGSPSRGKDSLASRGNPFPAVYQKLKQIVVDGFSHLRWGGTGWYPSKALSLLVLIGVISAIGWLHQGDDFFIYQEDASFRNLTYLGEEELYRVSDVGGWSIFWLDQDNIREAILEHPYIADARVSVGLPAKISVEVVEEQPVALWVTDAGTLWLLEDGTALAARHEETQGLLQILDGQAAARKVSPEPTVSINREVLDNARRLAGYFPSLGAVTFNSGFGLNFATSNGKLWVYWGDGKHFETKLKNLLTIQNELSQGRLTGQLADLRVPEKPIVR